MASSGDIVPSVLLEFTHLRVSPGVADLFVWPWVPDSSIQV